MQGSFRDSKLGERSRAARDVRPFVLGVFLVVYGNLAALVVGTATPATDPKGIGLSILLLVFMVAWIGFSQRLTAKELGLSRQHAVRSASLGVLVGLCAAVPALLFLRYPPLVGEALQYSPLSSLSREALLWRVFVWMPLDTAIPEEIAFRGVLLAALRRRLANRSAVLLSAMLFAVWHGVIVTRTVALTNLEADPVLAVLGLLGAFLAVGVGGVLFALLRLATDHLAGSMVAHWAFNAVLLLGLGGTA